MAAPPTEYACPEGDNLDRPLRQETVVIWATQAARRAEMVDLVNSAGWLPLVAETEAHAVQMLADAPPDLFVLAVEDDDADELSIIDQVRSGPDGEHVPVVCVLERHHRKLTLEAFGRRADDVVSGHPDPSELIARFRTRIERPPVPRSHLVVDPVTGALTSEAFAQQLSKEEERVRRGGDPGALAFIALDELPELTSRYGSRARDELLAQVVRLIKSDGRKLDYVGWRRGMIAILLPDTPVKGAQARFDRLVKKIYEREFVLDGETRRLTPVIGYTQTVEKSTVEQYEDRAWDALMYQADQLDLHPTKWVSAMSRQPTSSNRFKRAFDRYRTTFQVVTQQLAALVLPFLTYWMLDSLGADITGVVYLGLVMALGITATLIWGESHSAIEPTVPPPAPDEPPPRASAIIAAYLPNEAGTVIETVEAFLRQDYPDLEVILAYNTPTRLAVEDDLRAIADRDPRFVPLRVEGSVSKAQNVNTALARVTGEFLGLFDADHHPAPGSFHRAWRWIADGAGVVQGHCVIRNGDTNFVTRLVATEFEAIYAVSHPGRARLHGFGIFGGSNGYWRTSLLHRTRMRGSMLTEDIDSSMRVVQSGEVIISDPDLISTELAPDTAEALWNQRLRWAQGWSQVSLRHLIKMTRALPRFRQRLGAAYLLGWREIYPWISLQMFPLLAYWWFQGEPAIEWFVPIFVFTTLLTFSAGPAQIWYAWRLAHPSIKQHKKWFFVFGISSLLFYTEVKNIVGRTAHLKELVRERKWKVTPRTGSVALDAEAAHAEQEASPDREDSAPPMPGAGHPASNDPASNDPASNDPASNEGDPSTTISSQIADLADRWANDDAALQRNDVAADLSISPNALAAALDRAIADDKIATLLTSTTVETAHERTTDRDDRAIDDDHDRGNGNALGRDPEELSDAIGDELSDDIDRPNEDGSRELDLEIAELLHRTVDGVAPDSTIDDEIASLLDHDRDNVNDRDQTITTTAPITVDEIRSNDAIDPDDAPDHLIESDDAFSHVIDPDPDTVDVPFDPSPEPAPPRPVAARDDGGRAPRSAARRRRSRHAATTRRRRHHQVAPAATPPATPATQPSLHVYDRAREVTIYDHEQEEAERSRRRSSNPRATSDDRSRLHTDLTATAAGAGTHAPMPLMTPRLYEPDFLRQLIPRDRRDDLTDLTDLTDLGDRDVADDDSSPASRPADDDSPATSRP